MIRTRIFILIICFVMSGLSVTLLVFVSGFINSSPNHFVRMLPSRKIVGDNFIDLRKKGYYFAGIDHDFVYLGSKLKNTTILKVMVVEKQQQSLDLKVPEGLATSNDSYVIIDYNKMFVFEGIKGKVWSGRQSNRRFIDRISSPQFAKGIPLSSATFLFRHINKFNQNDLVKLNASGKIEIAQGLLTKQIDGLFCTDGQLIKVPNTNKVLYTYYYRNQFICADTNLNLLYRGKTIDTNIYAKIKVAKIRSRNLLTLSSPPMIVNKHASANEKYLFINCALKADNETNAMHEDAAAIHVYNVSDGKYKLSFYLPNFNGKRLTDFKVYGQSLYALYDHYLYKYKINF